MKTAKTVKQALRDHADEEFGPTWKRASAMIVLDDGRVETLHINRVDPAGGASLSEPDRTPTKESSPAPETPDRTV